MPKPNQRKYDIQHRKNVEKYKKMIQKEYISIIEDVVELGLKISFDPNSEFYFRKYPGISKKVDKLFDKFYENIYAITVEGVKTEWDLAVQKNDELTKYVFGNELKSMPKRYLDKYMSDNSGALNNFINRKIEGLSLSDRVWNNTQQLRQELELALELEIGKGTSASSIATKIKQYLNNPNKLFRRVRDEKGQLRLSKAAKVYHPGQGVYRSSYKNALRLAVNETNFSYEGSNFEKRKDLDFIVGMEIRTSPQHSEFDDMGGIDCNALQGLYPKEFDWTYKWHVNCKCVSLHVLKSEKELDEDVDLILNGEEPSSYSVNQVKELPKQYTDYKKDNKKKSSSRTFKNN